MKGFGSPVRRHPDQFVRCAVQMCFNECTTRYNIPLCHEHVLSVWAAVQRDMETAGRTLQDAEAEYREELAREERGRRAKIPGSIYYLRIGDYIKIGYTKSLHRRISQYPPNAKLLACHYGTLEDEKDLHARFAAYRESGREWYTEAQEILDHIDHVTATSYQSGSPVRRNVRRRHQLRPKSVRGFKVR